MITSKNLLYSSFIGLPVKIINSTMRNLVGCEGVVVDETKNLIVIKKGSIDSFVSFETALRGIGKEIKITKNSSVFRFYLQNKENVDIDGKTICFRPHERPKKV